MNRVLRERMPAIGRRSGVVQGRFFTIPKKRPLRGRNSGRKSAKGHHETIFLFPKGSPSGERGSSRLKGQEFPSIRGSRASWVPRVGNSQDTGIYISLSGWTPHIRQSEKNTPYFRDGPAHSAAGLKRAQAWKWSFAPNVFPHPDAGECTFKKQPGPNQDNFDILTGRTPIPRIFLRTHLARDRQRSSVLSQ